MSCEKKRWTPPYAERLKSKFSNLKVILQRASSYVNLLNTGMIAFLFLETLQSRGLFQNLKLNLLWVYPVGLIAMFLVGWIDWKAGLHSNEQKTIFERNPVITKISDDLDEIKRKLR